ncbi:MAG: redoxin domain-containing protein [Dehalococcoidia bacterium]|nr:redoxin domain-containing protein [Dehalococcoidia bacterium]
MPPQADAVLLPHRPQGIGSPAPEFSLAAASGATVSLADFRGRACVVLVFLRGFF